MTPDTPEVDSDSRPRKRLRFVLVDDHPVVRRGLADLINREPDMTVCGEADTVATGLACVQAERPDIAVVDLSLGQESGLDLVRAIRKALPAVRVLVLSMHDERLHAERVLAAGAHGYIMKQAAMRILIAAALRVASGKVYVSPAMSEQIVSGLSRHGVTDEHRPSPMARLTNREREVLMLVGQGCPPTELAHRLGISVKTVDTYKARIKEKLGLASASELMRVAVTWPDL